MRSKAETIKYWMDGFEWLFVYMLLFLSVVSFAIYAILIQKTVSFVVEAQNFDTERKQVLAELVPLEERYMSAGADITMEFAKEQGFTEVATQYLVDGKESSPLSIAR